MRRFLFVLFCLYFTLSLYAQEENKTLTIDYLFSDAFRRKNIELVKLFDLPVKGKLSIDVKEETAGILSRAKSRVGYSSFAELTIWHDGKATGSVQWGLLKQSPVTKCVYQNNEGSRDFWVTVDDNLYINIGTWFCLGNVKDWHRQKETSLDLDRKIEFLERCKPGDIKIVELDGSKYRMLVIFNQNIEPLQLLALEADWSSTLFFVYEIITKDILCFSLLINTNNVNKETIIYSQTYFHFNAIIHVSKPEEYVDASNK